VADAEARLVFNPLDGSLEVRLGSTGVTIDGVVAELVFERMTDDGEAALALWIEPREADVLAKMIRYILEKVRITEASKQTLEAVLPRVEAIAAGASEAEGSAG
jgi:hypothetical protein